MNEEDGNAASINIHALSGKQSGNRLQAGRRPDHRDFSD